MLQSVIVRHFFLLFDDDFISIIERMPQWSDTLLHYSILRLIPSFVKPNHVTVFRMFATPFVLLMLIRGYYGWGIIFFLLVALTDAIDGAMARTRNQITEWGKIYDPVADKLLIGSVVIVVVMRELGFFLGLTILCIETLFIFSAWWRLHTGRAVTANVWGKIKMGLQVLGVTALLLGLITDWPPFFPVSRATFLLAIIFALVSLVTYGI